MKQYLYLFLLLFCLVSLLTKGGAVGCSWGNKTESGSDDEETTDEGSSGTTTSGGDTSGGDTTSGSSNGSENEIGLSESDGVVGTLDGTDITFDLSGLTTNIYVTEGGEANKIYDTNDQSLSIMVSSDSANADRISFGVTILTYTDYVTSTIYEFTSSDNFSAVISLRRESDILTSYEVASIRLLFTSVPTSEGTQVAGSVEFTTVDAESIKANFSGTLSF